MNELDKKINVQASLLKLKKEFFEDSILPLINLNDYSGIDINSLQSTFSNVKEDIFNKIKYMNREYMDRIYPYLEKSDGDDLDLYFQDNEILDYRFKEVLILWAEEFKQETFNKLLKTKMDLLHEDYMKMLSIVIFSLYEKTDYYDDMKEITGKNKNLEINIENRKNFIENFIVDPKNKNIVEQIRDINDKSIISHYCIVSLNNVYEKIKNYDFNFNERNINNKSIVEQAIINKNFTLLRQILKNNKIDINNSSVEYNKNYSSYRFNNIIPCILSSSMNIKRKYIYLKVLFARGFNSHSPILNTQIYESLMRSLEYSDKDYIKSSNNIDVICSPYVIKIIKLLINNGYSINQVTNSGSCIFVLLTDKMESIFEDVLKLGADVNQKNHNGVSPLHVASARKETKKLALFLMKNGANLYDLPNSALKNAIMSSDYNMVDYLINNLGVDIYKSFGESESAVDLINTTILGYESRRGDYFKGKIEDCKKIKVIIEKKLINNPDIKNKSGNKNKKRL